MPIPKVVGRWNKAGLNRVTRHVAPWIPGLDLIVHRGRRSGRRYQTPVNVFSASGGYVIALTYGPGTDWVKNVLAAGGCELRTGGAGADGSCTCRPTVHRPAGGINSEHFAEYQGVLAGFTADTTPDSVLRIARGLRPHRVCVVSRHRTTAHFRGRVTCVSPGELGARSVLKKPQFDQGAGR
jgi:deazaflavin-dependent oxidoreductase (nitroreductase family)